MHVASRSSALAALFCVATAAFATQPSTYGEPASPGTILFARPLANTVDGHQVISGSAIFTIGDDGFGERQLTPYADDVYNLPDAWYLPFRVIEPWMPRAFSPSGRFSLFLKAHPGTTTITQQYSDGKYYIVNQRGQRTPAIFPGSNDLKKPKDGKSYGSLTWGPEGTDLIAYGNSSHGQPVTHACVYVIHPTGYDNHKLWCASGYYPTYKQAIEGLRWSGDGKSLLTYVALSPPGHPQQVNHADLYRIDVATGAATLVQANVGLSMWEAGDLSYDGNKVVFWSNGPGTCKSNVSEYRVVCVKNMLTGQKTALVDPDHILTIGGAQLLLTADGSKVIVRGFNNSSNVEELYLINADGTGLRRLTEPCVPLVDSYTVVTWSSIRLSPDDSRVLANCDFEHSGDEHGLVVGSKIYVINLADGSARFITDGRAYDWHVPST